MSQKESLRYKNPFRDRSLRFEICPCGSNRKIRKCHGKENWISVYELNAIDRIIKKLTKREKE